ncbi:hypothetical protein KIPB_013021, partial [Kipferlia bialata]|eukprot:g13021.t1
MAPGSLREVLSQVPPFTLCYGACVILLGVSANTGLIANHIMAWRGMAYVLKLQLWRLISPFLFHGGITLPMLMSLVMNLRFVATLEGDYY